MAATVKTRIQLKHDTEEHWNRAVRFIPLLGEPVIYDAESDGNGLAFPRLKVGDGIHTIVELPFIDAGSINGMQLDNIVAASLRHSITFGANQAYTFDGSSDVVVPVYNGAII